MNFTKLASAFFLSSSLIFSAACGLGDAVSDVQKGLDDAAKAAKKQEVGQKGFESAVSGVTAAVLEASMSAMTASTAPAFAPASTYATTGSSDINASSTANGGSVTAKGNITWTINSETTMPAGATVSTTTTSAKITLNLASTWTGMKLNIDNKVSDSSGNLTITGNIDFTQTDQNDPVVTGTLTEKGKFNVDADQYDVDVVITMTSTGGSYTGTINGNPVSGTYTDAK
jgi:hypothetical protein